MNLSLQQILRMKPNVEALLKRHKRKFADNVIYSSEIENMIDKEDLDK